MQGFRPPFSPIGLSYSSPRNWIHGLCSKEKLMDNLAPDIYKLLACPDCKKDVQKTAGMLQCEGCERRFEVTDDGIISMMPSNTLPPPEMYADPEYIEATKRSHELMTYFYESKSIVGYVNNAYHKIQLSLMEKYCLKGEITIDLGCGLGTHLKYCSQYARKHWVGLDVRMNLLQSVKKLYPDVQLVQGDLCQLPFRVGFIQNVLCSGVLEHVYYLENAVSEIKRVLTSSGLFFMTIPMEGGFLWHSIFQKY